MYMTLAYPYCIAYTHSTIRKVCSTVSNNNSKHVELYALYSVSYSLRLLELSMLRRLTCTLSTLDSESTLREAWPPSGRN